MHGITRRSLLRAGGAAFVAGATCWPAIAGTEWSVVAPADAGFAPDIAARLEQLVSSGRAWNLHGVVVARAGRIVLEHYFAGEDETWVSRLGNVAFGPATLHDMRSVTKSIVALLYGIALAGGKVPGPDAPLMAAFPEYADLAQAGRERLTIGHALTMTLGTNWNEEIPYTDPANSEIAMEMAPDRYRFILGREVVMEPGVKWTYSGGATALLGRLIAKGTGMALPDFARRVLFEPLGIAEIGWARGLDGEASAASGLRLTPRDLARIGIMIMNAGQWNGRQIVPAEWLVASLRPRVRVDEHREYGYHWYCGSFAVGAPPSERRAAWVGAFGNGGQRLFVLPQFDLSIAITAGNYNTPEQWQPPIRVVREVILPSIL